MRFMSVEDSFEFASAMVPGNLIEAGVYNGNSLSRLVKLAEQNGITFKEVWGFDSFQGLPADAINDNNPDWKEGSFNVLCDDNFASVEDAIAFIKNRVGRPDINLVPGWFEDTMTAQLGLRLTQSASYINIDCDIYSSTLTMLKWLFNHRIPKIYAIIRYDDWNSTDYSHGQRLAHRQIEARYNVWFHQLEENVFQVIRY